MALLASTRLEAIKSCPLDGLTTEEGVKRLQIFGPNKLEEKKESKFLKFLGFMWNPLSWVMEVAAIMAIALANGGVVIFPLLSLHPPFFFSSGFWVFFFFCFLVGCAQMQGESPDWQDFIGILVLLFIYSTISFIE